MTDIAIIGGGPAGLTAAIYAARAGKAVTVFERESMGGQITHAHKVSNYPGFTEISGTELGDKFCAQAMDMGAEIEFTNVESVEKEGDTFRITAEDGEFTAKSLIFAGGAKPRPLGVEREEELTGAGVSYCALCDGAFFAGKDVAVVGGGNSAFSDALFLAGVARSVTLIHRRDSFRAEPKQIEAAKAAENIRFLTSCTVTALLGENQVTGLRLSTGEEISVDGVFVALGRIPDTSLIADLADLDEAGYVLSDESCETKTRGLYVAGDCRKKGIRQVTTAVSDGTAAATAAAEYLDM